MANDQPPLGANGQLPSGLCVAVASYDQRLLRIQCQYIAAFCSARLCQPYQSGQALLDDLAAGLCYDVIILDNRLSDMDALAFAQALHTLPHERTSPLLLFTFTPSLEKLAPCLPGLQKYCIMEPYHLYPALQELLLHPGTPHAPLEEFCRQLYRSWGAPSGYGTQYLTRAVAIALASSQHLALRKQILAQVSACYHVSEDAVASSIRRLILALEQAGQPAWQSFKAGIAGSGSVTTGKLIEAMRQLARRAGY